MAKNKKTQRRKKKKRINVSKGVIRMSSSFNNMIITLTDVKGNVLAWSSAGKIGYKDSKKSTPYAAKITAEDIAEQAINMGIRTVDVVVSGPGQGRQDALKALNREELTVTSILDKTPIPHNGCRPPKQRRI